MSKPLAHKPNSTQLMGSYRGPSHDEPGLDDPTKPNPSAPPTSGELSAKGRTQRPPISHSGIRPRPRSPSQVNIEALKAAPIQPTPSSIQLRPSSRLHQPGDVIAERFELLGLIGEGSASLVFSAHDRLEERMVAVKMLRPELLREETLQQRMRYEAQLTSSLFSPHVVEIIALGQLDDTTSYFAMELLEGETLDEVLMGPLPSYKWIREIGTQIAKGLATAHAKGIVHRDLKPSNIFIVQNDGEPCAKILDFGVATRPVDSTLTKPGTVLGTPHYMAPEQALAFSEVDHRADIYSLGTILFELASGRPPFDADDSMSLVMAHLNEQPERLDELRSDVPSGFADIVARCLEKKPSGRFRSAAELVAALAAICNGGSDKASCHQERDVTLLAVADAPAPNALRRDAAMADAADADAADTGAADAGAADVGMAADAAGTTAGADAADAGKGSQRRVLAPAAAGSALALSSETQASPSSQQLILLLVLITLLGAIAWQLMG